MIKTLIILAVIVVGGLAGFSWLTMHWSYSSGERAGYVQKLSKKGWVCKTWEGEMAIVTMPGTVSEKFLFTIRDDSVAAAQSTRVWENAWHCTTSNTAGYRIHASATRNISCLPCR